MQGEVYIQQLVMRGQCQYLDMGVAELGTRSDNGSPHPLILKLKVDKDDKLLVVFVAWL